MIKKNLIMKFSQDVYNIFNELGFKNIIIQNTTPTDIDFIANVNLKFYENLIINKIKNINDIYNDALNTNINKDVTTFCCCFHEHKINCNFMKNIKNELYNDKEVKSTLDELTKTLPHFCHLKPKCVNRYPNCDFPNDFCYHLEKCRDDFTIKNYMVYSFVEKIKIKKSLYPAFILYIVLAVVMILISIKKIILNIIKILFLIHIILQVKILMIKIA